MPVGPPGDILGRSVTYGTQGSEAVGNQRAMMSRGQSLQPCPAENEYCSYPDSQQEMRCICSSMTRMDVCRSADCIKQTGESPTASRAVIQSRSTEQRNSDWGLPSREVIQSKGQDLDQSGQAAISPPSSRGLRAFSIPAAATDVPTGSPRLNKQYFVRHSRFYTVGRVFAVLWHENFNEAGAATTYKKTGQTYVSNKVSRGPYGEPIYSSIRRMVVVREDHGFCVCIQINTYGGRGLVKFGPDSKDVHMHSRIYMDHKAPKWLDAEPISKKKDIAVRRSSLEQRLSPASRVCYSRPHTVEHTVKSMDVGIVDSKSLASLLSQYAKENQVVSPEKVATSDNERTIPGIHCSSPA